MARPAASGLVHDQVGPLGDDLEVVVGDEGGDLHDQVVDRVEAGHLEVHPGEHGSTAWYRGGPRGRRRPAAYHRCRARSSPCVRLDPDLPLPAYAKPGDAGVDLRAREDVTLPPGGGRALVPTGLAVAIPEGYAGFVQPRSGLALRPRRDVPQHPGLIDAGYRGELKVLLVNTDPAEAVP